MEKLPMCRICLLENVRMFVVVNRNLHKLYEKLTDIPFVTKDSRPILACFFCCAKLKQCYRLLRQCVAAEELFTQMMNEDYECNLLNQGNFEFYSGLIKSETVHMSIVDESVDIKEELPAVCEELDDIIEPNEEHQSDELELESLHNSCLDEEDIPPHHSESDSEDDVPLVVFKIEEQADQEKSKKKRRAGETEWATVAKKPKLDTRRTNLEDAITAERTRQDKSDSKVPGTYFKEPYKCDQRSSNPQKKMIQHARTQIGKEPFKCDVCQRSFSTNVNLTKHIRVHTGENRYECDVCQRSFSEKRYLRNHMLIHLGVKPYKCDFCQSNFRQKGALSIHIRTHTHTGKNPFKCDICQRSFRVRGNLTKHINTHTGPENPSECGKHHKMIGWKVEGQNLQPVFVAL